MMNLALGRNYDFMVSTGSAAPNFLALITTYAPLDYLCCPSLPHHPLLCDHIALDFDLFLFLSSTSLCLHQEATGRTIFATLGQRDGITEEIH